MHCDMATGTTFPLVDKIMEGRLDEQLRRWRSESLSYEQIARRLLTDFEVDINSTTVRRWCIEQGIDTPKARAS